MKVALSLNVCIETEVEDLAELKQKFDQNTILNCVNSKNTEVIEIFNVSTVDSAGRYDDCTDEYFEQEDDEEM